VSLCNLLHSTVCPLSLSTSHCAVCWFCVTISTAAFYILSNVCQYLTLYRILVLCHYIHCCLLQSVYCLSVPQNVPYVGSVSLCPLLSSTICPMSVSTPHSTDCWFCVSKCTIVFYSLPTACQYLTLRILTVTRILVALLNIALRCFTLRSVTNLILISVFFRQPKRGICWWLSVLSGHYMNCFV
jgi:hypothetical protein